MSPGRVPWAAWGPIRQCVNRETEPKQRRSPVILLASEAWDTLFLPTVQAFLPGHLTWDSHQCQQCGQGPWRVQDQDQAAASPFPFPGHTPSLPQPAFPGPLTAPTPWGRRGLRARRVPEIQRPEGLRAGLWISLAELAVGSNSTASPGDPPRLQVAGGVSPALAHRRVGPPSPAHSFTLSLLL